MTKQYANNVCEFVGLAGLSPVSNWAKLLYNNIMSLSLLYLYNLI